MVAGTSLMLPLSSGFRKTLADPVRILWLPKLGKLGRMDVYSDSSSFCFCKVRAPELDIILK